MKNFLISLLFLMGPTLCFGATAVNEATGSSSVESANVEATSQQLLGYKEWKKNQVFDARKSLDEFKSPQLSKMQENDQASPATNSAQSSVDNVVDSSGDKSESPKSDVTEKGNAVKSSQTPQASDEGVALDGKAEKLRQLEFNLEIAQGLTIHDYFALYLKSKSKAEMAEAIKQLSPDELSELLMAYRQSLYGAPPIEASQETAFQ